MKEEWSGVEIGLSRFIDLCNVLKRTEAASVIFLTDGTAYVESGSKRGRRGTGDYAFFFELGKTNHPVLIPARELLATFQLLGLHRDTLRTVRGQSIHLADRVITVHPRETTYRRRLLTMDVNEATEMRLKSLSRFSLSPNLTLVSLRKRDGRRVGIHKVRLSLGPAVLHHARGVTRIAGFSTVRAVLSVESRSARSLLTICEQDAAEAESFVSGQFTGDILYLRSRRVLARIKPSIEMRKPT